MRIEEVIGQRIQELRKAQPGTGEMSQEKLGSLLEPLLGKPWSRQAVSAAEAGKRAFTAVELVALAAVLDTTIDDLFDPRWQAAVTMPSGVSLRMGYLERLRKPEVDNDDRLRDDLMKVLVLLGDSIVLSEGIESSAARAAEVTREAQNKIPAILRYLETKGEQP